MEFGESMEVSGSEKKTCEHMVRSKKVSLLSIESLYINSTGVKLGCKKAFANAVYHLPGKSK